MINFSVANYNQNQYSRKIVPSTKHNVAFCAMKKSQFKGLDLAVVEKYKAPIEKFNILNDLQNWAKTQAQKIASMDFGGRQAETKVQRKAMIKEWFDYVFKENDAYTFAAALLVLGAITKELKPDNDKLPPVLNKGVLADCVSEIDKNTKADSKYQFDLNKMYETKLRALYLEDTKIEGGDTGWVVIPSQTNDPENFESNVEKLKTLSHKNWCTKSLNAEPYLRDGDFHVYLENGQPKLGVRFIGNKIKELQGELNNGKVPIAYYEGLQKYISENNLKLTQDAKEELKEAKKINKKVRKIKKNLNVAIENNDVKTIFEYFGIKVKEDNNGFFIISSYEQASESFTFKDCGIDENVLLRKVKCIGGNADFSASQVTDLSNLKSIGGNADFEHSQVTNLCNLESVGGNADFNYSQVTNLCNLKSIGGYADFEHSQVTNLYNLKSIEGNAFFRNSQVTNLCNLKYIEGNAYIDKSQEKHLGTVLRKLTTLNL